VVAKIFVKMILAVGEVQAILEKQRCLIQNIFPVASSKVFGWGYWKFIGYSLKLFLYFLFE
jgi:hypothetical protein